MFGPRHPATLGVLSDLATVLQQLGELRRASELYATVLPALLDVSGPDDQQTAVCANNYAVLLLRVGAHEEARSWFTAALPGLERHYGPAADIFVSARSDLAECEAVTRRTEDPAEVRRWIEARAGRRPTGADTPTDGTLVAWVGGECRASAWRAGYAAGTRPFGSMTYFLAAPLSNSW